MRAIKKQAAVRLFVRGGRKTVEWRMDTMSTLEHGVISRRLVAYLN